MKTMESAIRVSSKGVQEMDGWIDGWMTYRRERHLFVHSEPIIRGLVVVTCFPCVLKFVKKFVSFLFLFFLSLKSRNLENPKSRNIK